MIKNLGIGQPNNVGGVSQTGTTTGLQKNIKDSDLFKNLLDKEIGSNGTVDQADIKKITSDAKEILKFSSHALERIQNRGIRMMKEDVEKLNEAVEKASKKGAKDALVVMGENAFIVSVKNKTVITAVDKNMLKENVFTNIDSTVFA